MSAILDTGILLQTYDKSQKSTTFKLIKMLAKDADIKTVKVTTELGETKDILLFKIKVGTHRAFDVDSSQQLFVVVEEAQSPGGQRKVLLYRRDQHTPVSTYTPPTAACTCRAMNSSLTAAWPRAALLVQPTALNTDTQGRLWVACRGGAILTFTPIK